MSLCVTVFIDICLREIFCFICDYETALFSGDKLDSRVSMVMCIA
jgi:hypothetical protein